MTYEHRRILLFGLSVLFVLASAGLMLWSSGYRLDLATQRVVQTTIVVAKTDVAPDRVRFDGRAVDAKGMSLRITDVLPGTHTVRLEKDGFFPWEFTFVTASGKPFDLGELTFVRDAEPVTMASDVRSFRVSPDGKSVAVVSGATPSVRFMSPAGAETKTVTLGNAPVDIAWAPNSDLLLAVFDGAPGAVIDPRSGSIAALPDWTDHATRLGWKDDETVLGIDGTVLRSIEHKTGTTMNVFPSAADWYRDGNTLTVALTTGEILEGQGASFSTLIQLRQASLRFLPSPSGRLTIMDTSTRTLHTFPRSEPSRSNEFHEVTQAAWSPDGTQLAFGNDVELHLFRLNTDTTTTLQRTSEILLPYVWQTIGKLPFLAAATDASLTYFLTGNAFLPRLSIPVAGLSSLAPIANGLLALQGQTLVVLAN